MEPLLTLAEAAAALRVSKDWLSGAARRGVVPARKVGRYWRFSEGDLTTYLDSVRNRDPWERSAGSKARRRPPTSRRG